MPETLQQNNINQESESPNTEISRRNFLKFLRIGSTALGINILVPGALNRGERPPTPPPEEPLPNTEYARLLKEKIEQQPYISPYVQGALIHFFEANNHIKPVFLKREEWDKKSEEEWIKITAKEGDKYENCEFYIPEDLQLWEMPLLIKQADEYIYRNKPDKSKLSRVRWERLNKLGQDFENAGVYLATSMQKINPSKVHQTYQTQARSIAKDMALGFYRYGMLLQDKPDPLTKITAQGIDAVVQVQQPDQITHAQTWLLTPAKLAKKQDLVRARLSKQGQDPDNQTQFDQATLEEETKTLTHYFVGLAKQGYYQPGTYTDKEGLSHKLQQKTKESITSAIELPAHEFENIAYLEGMEFVKAFLGFDQMKDKLKKLQDKEKHTPLNWLEEKNKWGLEYMVQFLDQGYTKLHQVLKIDQNKQILKQLRKTGNLEKITHQELKIIKEFKDIIFRYPYKKRAALPRKVVDEQLINCISASYLSEFLNQLDIKYSRAILPEHAVNILHGSNGKYYYFDNLSLNRPIKIEEENFFTDYAKQKEIENNRSLSKAEKEKQIQELSKQEYQKFLAYMKKPTDQGIHLKGANIDGKAERYIEVGKPEILNKITIITHKAGELETKETSSEKRKEIIELYKMAIRSNPHVCYIYLRLAMAYKDNNQLQKAIECYKRTIQIHDQYDAAYFWLGLVYDRDNQLQKAIECYKKAIEIDTQYSDYYYFLATTYEKNNQPHKAIESYKNYLRIVKQLGLEDKEKYWINKAEEKIKKIKKIISGV